eukprot:s368_g12.t1
MASVIRVLLRSSLSGERGYWFTLRPDAKVADVKFQAKYRAPKKESQVSVKTFLLYENEVLSNSNLRLLDATGHKEDQREMLYLEFTAIYQEGSHQCCFCHRKLEEAERSDDFPQWILKCGNGCNERTCRRCWDLRSDSERVCPKCNASVSEITEAITEELVDPDRVISEGPELHLRPRDCEPRAYQQAAFEAVHDSNRIVCLPTGTGKTLIATMAIDHFLLEEEELIPGAFACFLVNQVALVKQQAEAIRKHSIIEGIKVIEITGATTKSKRDWWEQAKSNQVLVVTAEVLRQAVVDHAFLQLDADCKLLVFDEAHHAVGKSAYVRILEKVKDLQHGPRLVGLTACYLHGKYQKPDVKKNSLEEKFQGTMWLPSEEDIKDYLPEFTYERVPYEKNTDFQ